MATERVARLLSGARKTLDMDLAFIATLDGTRQVFTYLDGDGESFGWEVGMALPQSEGFCGYMLSGQLPNIVADARGEDLTSRLPTTHDADIGSYVGVPVVLGSGEVYGTLCAIDHRLNHRLGPADVAFMHMLATLVAEELTSLERDEAAARLRRHSISRWLAPGALTMHVQPIVDLHTGRTVGGEALARFLGVDENPANLFAAACSVGLGVDLELAAIQAALKLLTQLQPHCYLSVNASPAAVEDPRLLAALTSHAGDKVVLELTEHAAFAEHPHLFDHLREIRNHGVRVAIDDVGSGYASMQSLLALTPEIIKLDIALIKNVDRDRARRSLVAAMALFARETGSTLVAEGIETPAELSTLKELGVHLGQGYLLGRPAPLSTTHPVCRPHAST